MALAVSVATSPAGSLVLPVVLPWLAYRFYKDRPTYVLKDGRTGQCPPGTQPVMQGRHVGKCFACPPGKIMTYHSVLPNQCNDPPPRIPLPRTAGTQTRASSRKYVKRKNRYYQRNLSTGKLVRISKKAYEQANRGV